MRFQLVVVCIVVCVVTANALNLVQARKKRQAAAVAQTALGLGGGKGGVLSGFAKKMGLGDVLGNATSDLIKGSIQKVLDKILNKDHMLDIDKEITSYLKEWQQKSNKRAKEATEKLETIMTQLGQKNQDLMNSRAKIEIIPQKGMQLEGMFSPPGYKIETSYGTQRQEPDSTAGVAYKYNQGIGNVLINGCYKPALDVSDPCYPSKRLLPTCSQLLEGASFIGVGFDGRGLYSSASRKRSIIQRVCLRGQSYSSRSIPDAMSVHGIYDTDVQTKSFNSMRGYQSYLEDKSAVAKSQYMFIDAVNKAYGQASGGLLGFWGVGGGFSSHNEQHRSRQSSGAQSGHSIGQKDTQSQMYMSMLEVKVARYEIFMDDITPNDLNMDFLQDFTTLPVSYFQTGAPQRYQDFVALYGTHYIKSAKFGGSLRLFKVKKASKSETIDQFAVKAQADYKAMFSTYAASTWQFKSRSWFHKAEGGGSKSVSKGGGNSGASSAEKQQSQKIAEQQQYSNEVLSVEGGNQAIAAVISEMYTVGFKHELVDWLKSIPTYPKPIEMQMEAIYEICNINWKQLFPDAKVDFGCFGQQKLSEEPDTGRKYYVWKTELINKVLNKTTFEEHRRYCDFDSQQHLQKAMKRRCNSLKLATAVYLEEGPTPVSDIFIPAGKTGCDELPFNNDKKIKPKWEQLTDGRVFQVTFDLTDAILGVADRNSVVKVYYRKRDRKWHSTDFDNIVHLYDGWGNGGSDDVYIHKKISIRGLVTTYNDGILTVTEADYKESLNLHPDLHKKLIGMVVAKVAFLHPMKEIQQHKSEYGIGSIPCNIVWSNTHRFNPASDGGKCISFAAISSGDIFVIFSAIPQDRNTWYYVQISSDGVAIYKGLRVMSFIDDRSARGLGHDTLFQLYFVCVEEKESGTTILYGKTLTTQERGHVYGTFHDTHDKIPVRFYAFGSGVKQVSIMDAHVMRTDLNGEHVCRGDSRKIGGKCLEFCHSECNGCTRAQSDQACRQCRHNKLGNKCVKKCPSTHIVLEGGDHITCRPKSKVTRCPNTWTEHLGKCYRFMPCSSRDECTSHKAQAACTRIRYGLNQHAHLVDIRSSQVNKIVASLPGTTEYIHVGGAFVEDRNTWIDHDGLGMKYHNWAAGQPDKRGQQWCIMVEKSSGQWHDISCSQTYDIVSTGYVCQRAVRYV